MLGQFKNWQVNICMFQLLVYSLNVKEHSTFLTEEQKGNDFFKKRKHDSTNLKDIQEKRDKENRQPPLGEWKEICKNVCKKVSSRILS